MSLSSMKKNIILVFLLLSAAIVYGTDKSERIISLAPSITRSLYELGAEKEIVGITRFCPKGTTNKEIIGTMWEPVLERIVALEPTLVIATKEGNKQASVQKLKELGINVLVLNNASDFEQISLNFKEIARNIGRSEKADVLINDIQKALSKYKMRKHSKIKVFWQVGVRPLFTAGKKSFVSSFHEYAGGFNIFQDQNKSYLQVNREEVIKRGPDIIFITNMNNSPDEQTGIWQKIPGFNPEVVVLINDSIFTPTPRTYLEGVKAVCGSLEKIPAESK